MDESHPKGTIELKKNKTDESQDPAKVSSKMVSRTKAETRWKQIETRTHIDSLVIEEGAISSLPSEPMCAVRNGKKKENT